jgi:hypothetical protein
MLIMTDRYATSNVVAGHTDLLNMPRPYLIIRSIQIINGGSRSFLEPRDTSFFGEYNPTGCSRVSLNTMDMWDEDVVVFSSSS